MSSPINRTTINYTIHTPRQAIQQGKAPAELADKEQTESLNKATAATPFPKAFKPYFKNEQFNPWSLIPAVLGGVTLSIGALIPDLKILLALFVAGFGMEIAFEKMRQSDAKETNDNFKQALNSLKNKAKERPLNTPLSQKELEPFEPQQQKEQIQWFNNILSPALCVGFVSFVLSAFRMPQHAEEKRKALIALTTVGATMLTVLVATVLEKNAQNMPSKKINNSKKNYRITLPKQGSFSITTSYPSVGTANLSSVA